MNNVIIHTTSVATACQSKVLGEEKIHAMA
jgi:hypothetical protein